MSKIKVLIVDDSAVIRAALKKILSKDDNIEVVGAAPDPYIAVQKIKKLNPDVLTLDVEMPRMDGLTFLERIMKSHPMPVVMISTWTRANSEKAIKSLSLGAVDVIEKPGNNDTIKQLESEIIEKVKNAAKSSMTKIRNNVSSSNQKNGSLNVKEQANTTNNLSSYNSNKIVLIGASTGGTLAIETIIKSLPSNMPGIVCVLHMPANFTNAFAERLNSLSELTVKEAKNGDVIRSNTVYIAPGNTQCYLYRSASRYAIQVTDDPPVSNHKPSVNALFLSASKYPSKNFIGVILTGMGKDGAKGLLKLRQSGSYNIAQDEESSIVFGMPGEAIELGAAHEIQHLETIPSRLIDLTRKN